MRFSSTRRTLCMSVTKALTILCVCGVSLKHSLLAYTIHVLAHFFISGFKPKKVPENLDAIIIGSGIGGLTTAVLLGRAGQKVLVLEQHDQAGGCCHTFVDKGYEFDTGILYFEIILYLEAIIYHRISPHFSRGICFVCFVALSHQLWSWSDSQFTYPHFFLGKLEQAINHYFELILSLVTDNPS